MMDIAQLIALPMEPCIRVRVTPTETVEVSQERFELYKQDLLILCASIPIGEGLSHRLMMSYTGNNRTLAKLLVGLGALVHVWRLHPSVEVPALWSKSRLYPMAIPFVTESTKTRVPKPSRGDMEADLKPCACCERLMAPADNLAHDVLVSDYRDDLCSDCEMSRCEPGGPCQWDSAEDEFASIFQSKTTK